jgi:AcrR family transcriptional regulator
MATRGRPRSFDREEALRRAMELFWQRGYESTSIADPTDVMGIHSPSPYAAFGSKEALFREAVELYDAREGEVTRRAFAEPTARAAVEAMLRGNADTFADPATPTGCMVVLGSIAVPDEAGGVAPSCPSGDGRTSTGCGSASTRRCETVTSRRRRTRLRSRPSTRPCSRGSPPGTRRRLP